MAVLLGNLALLLDVSSTSNLVQDRKALLTALDLVLNLHKRDLYAYHASIAVKGLEPDGEGRSQRVIARGKSSSKANGGIDFESDEDTSADDTNFEGDDFDWGKEMRRRVKEIEERRELARKTEEFVESSTGGIGGVGGSRAWPAEPTSRLVWGPPSSTRLMRPSQSHLAM